MALTAEWEKRLKAWRNELELNCYRPLCTVPFDGFITTEQLTLGQALRRPYKTMPVGTEWGGKWEYAWFKGHVRIPAEARGKRVAMRVRAGSGGRINHDHFGEGLVYVNGQIAGSQDWAHGEITLARSAKPGTRYQVVAEYYAGHGDRECHGGPVSDMRVSVKEAAPRQCRVGESTIGVWEEDVYQLCMDIDVLRGIRDHIDPDSLRVSRIDEALKQMTFVVELESGYDTMIRTVREARRLLQPLMACTNGSTAPTLFAFGHAHLDVAWLWPLQETERKVARTFGNQLKLMEEYPEYRFLNSQPHLYRMVKNLYPELYRRIKAAVKKGSLVAEGGMWVEADTNISGGEALIRQFIHGMRFFREEFGVENEMLWLPDVFGYSGALPQIMRGCGINYFGTAKIYWTYNGGVPFPHSTFTWRGIDGSEVLVNLLQGYGVQTYPGNMIGQWKGRRTRDGISTLPVAFGWGDGGGGANRTHLELLSRQKDIEGVPRVRMASPVEFYRDQEERGVPDTTYVGELYFQAHRGTYTSQARTKKGNRDCELALREAELWGCAARALTGMTFTPAELDEPWKVVLLNQFHDVLPGSSISRVYQEAEAAYDGVRAAAAKVTHRSQAKLASGTRGVTVFNSLSWERDTVVALPSGVSGLATADGTPVAVQKVGKKTIARVTVPSCGWTTLQPSRKKPFTSMVTATAHSLENELIKVTLNHSGEITGILDKETGEELTDGVCNRLAMYKDVPSWFDAWDIDSMYKETPVALSRKATVTAVSEGPVAGVVRVERTVNNSSFTQNIVLRAGSRRVDFETVVDWQEGHKLLKVCFPVAVHASEAIHEIQFGHIRRPNHASSPFDEDRFEVSNHKWTALAEENHGCAVLNNCKYGVNVVDNSINLTLLKSPLAPDATADRGEQRFTYSFYAWNGSFGECGLVREGYDLNVPVAAVKGAGGEQSLLSVDAPNVVIETVKPAEDGSRDIVVRLYESKRSATRCRLSWSLPVSSAEETNMVEAHVRGLRAGTTGVALRFKPFEVKTVRLRVRR